MRKLSCLAAFCALLAVALVISCEDNTMVEEKPAPYPVAHITSPPGPVCITPGQSVSFAGHGTGGDPPYSYLWKFRDPAIADTTAQNPGAVSFPNTGTFHVEFHVYDSDGRHNFSRVVVTVKPDCDPVVASIDQPGEGSTFTEGQVVSFSGSASGGGPPYTYAWAFGDGDSAFTQNPSHSYAAAGPYEVVLSVRDDFWDSGADTVNITVTQSSGTGIALPITGVDGLSIAAPFYVGLAGPLGWVMGYGQDGIVAIDTQAQTVYRTFLQGQSFLSGLTLSPASGASPREALFVYNSSGAEITYWDSGQNDFGMSLVVEFGGVTDAAPYGDDPASGGCVYTMPSALKALDYNVDGNFMYQSLNSGSGFFPGRTGDLMSSFARDATGSIVVVTDGSPGQLFLAPRPSAMAALIGEVGSAPRQIRCVDSLCVISCFDADSLWVATWDDEDNVIIVGGVPVGDGPIGIDLLALGSGNVAAVSTGFNDNTYTITVFGPTGAVISNDTQAVPAGCTAPPHAVWVPGGTRDILFSCNATNNVFILPSGL